VRPGTPGRTTNVPSEVPPEAAAAAGQDRPLMYRLRTAAALVDLAEDFLRRTPDLPKVLIRGAGAKDSRSVVGILHEDLVAWLQRHRQGVDSSTGVRQ
jgi:hypothetical protein